MVQQHHTLKWPTLRVALNPAAVFECWSPSCPALCHLVLGVVARAVHLAQEKKIKKRKNDDSVDAVIIN